MLNSSSFGQPHEYCDVQCERCVFEHECVIARELRNARWLDEVDVGESFLSFDAEGRKDATDALAPQPLLNGLGESRRFGSGQPFIERLRRAGVSYSLSLCHLLQKSSAPFTEVFRDAEIAAALIAPKVARLTMSLRPGGELRFDPSFADDGYRTLMLIEHVDERTTLALSVTPSELSGFAATFDRARSELWELLAPLSAQVPPRARAELARLVMKRRAPSPFFVIPN